MDLNRGVLCCAPGCYRRDSAPVGGVPLCPVHLGEIRAALDITPLRLLADTNVVYYVTWPAVDFVKIGTTSDLPGRLAQLNRDTNRAGRREGPLGKPVLLATEHGSFRLERERHAQFRHLRLSPRKEFFQLAPDLEEHIDATAGSPVCGKLHRAEGRTSWRPGLC